MSVPLVSDPIWQRVISGEASPDFEFLATRIFLGRARLMLSRDPSPRTLASLAAELRGIFAKNSSHPSVLRDLKQLP